jgi:diaminopimelate epimerase
MEIKFSKYQGTGNDFVIFDNRSGDYNNLNKEQVKFLCHRRFGIGADGLMLLNTKEGYDFEMKYYNSDGGESTMCGNGGRCLVKFAYDKGMIQSKYCFLAIDGSHEASIDIDGIVSLKMQDVTAIQEKGADFILNTGSPHYIAFEDDVAKTDVVKKGAAIRNSPAFAAEGINVNFVQQADGRLIVRTYERGVEDETFSCGTGVTAAAIVCHHNENGFNHVRIQTKGGTLSVEYDKMGDRYENVWLSGPAVKVFEGTLVLD